MARSAVSFIVTSDVTLVGMFSPNGFETIKPGAAVKIVFGNHPGRIYHAKIVEIPAGVGLWSQKSGHACTVICASMSPCPGSAMLSGVLH